VNLGAYLDRRKSDVDAVLETILPLPEGPAARLLETMRYAVFSGGKRLRPVLALAACEAFGGSIDDVLAPAAALELVHTYSLIHDDLPAMDDDDLRRGRPTAHKAFGEAEAILAGDALLTLAFEVLATRPVGEALASRRTEAVAVVARRAGHSGMVGGQQADLEAERKPPAEASLAWIHRHKTGALISASVEIGALHGGAEAKDRVAMSRFGESVGLAFQIIDDVLDRTASASALGKTPGKDEKSGKATYPALIGLDASRREAERLVALAMESIPATVKEPAFLEALARYAIDRAH
jgi:geranylgeranyl diphosphate synthase type II